ncbi:MAG: DUF2007 domain-containing protein [Tannerella sp.]|jgi:hypothetical protein|nr:DUF2007 domain-containing protein [Tannerella sp.]
MDRIVEIANFRYTDRAEILASLLRGEGIACYVRNGISSNVFGGGVDIGAKVELQESDAPRALEIMKAYGYPLPDEILQADYGGDDPATVKLIPFLRKFAFDRQILIIIALTLGLLALLLFAGHLLSSQHGAT